MEKWVWYNADLATLANHKNKNRKHKMKTQTYTVKVRDLKVGDIVRLNDEDHTIEKLAPYGTSNHSLIVVTDKTSPHSPWSMDKLMELELVGFMSTHFTIPVKPKVKRKSKIVQRIEDAGYHIEKTGQEWHVWHEDDHSVTAIYDRLRDIPCFPPYV